MNLQWQTCFSYTLSREAEKTFAGAIESLRSTRLKWPNSNFFAQWWHSSDICKAVWAHIHLSFTTFLSESRNFSRESCIYFRDAAIEMRQPSVESWFILNAACLCSPCGSRPKAYFCRHTFVFLSFLKMLYQQSPFNCPVFIMLLLLRAFKSRLFQRCYINQNNCYYYY